MYLTETVFDAEKSIDSIFVWKDMEHVTVQKKRTRREFKTLRYFIEKK